MRIKSIQKVEPREVIALQTTTGTFIADGLAHHNCYHCNVNLSGNWVVYERNMIAQYGIETVDILKKRQKLEQGDIWDIARYKLEIEKYERI
jgi:hypothetical protein